MSDAADECPSPRFADTSQQIYLHWMRCGRPPALSLQMATKVDPERAVTMEGIQKLGKKKMDEEQEPTKALSMELAYVTERIIGLWFPSLEIDSKGTNKEVQEKMLEEATSMLMVKHAENCMVFDLSTVDGSQEHTITSHYLGWQGITLAPPLERLCSACKYIESWLSSDPQHVAVLFARGPCSKERIGVIVSAYLTYTGICGSEEQALDRFAMRRFFQDKIGHLRSPSSLRYIGHFSGLLSGGIRMNAEPLFLKYIAVSGSPAYKSKERSQGESVCFFLKIYQQGLTLMYTSPVYELSSSSEHLIIGMENTLLRGDVLLKGYRLCRDCPRRHHSLQRHSLFQCQFHTCAVAKSSLCFSRAELDVAEDSEVKYPPDNGNLELHFSSQKDLSTFENSPLSPSSALYLPYADEDEAVMSSIIAHDSMEELCSKGKVTDASNFESTESWANGVLDEVDGEGGPEYLTGPLDGSLYATVSKVAMEEPGFELSRSEALQSPSHEQHLDELLGDMLMTVENIPDLRPSDDEDIPYHARKDGRPFTYGAVPERKPREEDMQAELSSPGLVRKASRNIAQETSPTSDGYSNLTWLQLQQQKLRDRREGKTRQERNPQEFHLLKELRTYQRSSSSGSQTLPIGVHRREDGYASDTSLPVGNHYLPDYNGSVEWERNWRENGENLTLPLRINTTEKSGWSDAGSPLITRRSVSREKASRYGQTAKWKEENTLRTIGSGVVVQPTCSDNGERAFVAVKRAHEYAATGRRSKDSTSSMDDGITPMLQSRDDSFSSWATASMTWGDEEDADEEMADEMDSRKGKTRPQTPAFPVHPRTPYSNGPMGYVEQSSEIHGKASLPPKSPQAIRKDHSHAVVSPDFQGVHPGSNSANHKQTTASTLPKAAHHEVSPAHVKFVRDTSRFWYKPTISREEAIAILKDKPPGTFIVRDSNSFPGAFGLALKVASPPANVPCRTSSNPNVDISNELVRHFLIEPTSRGVKLKGCINEPVFSSLSALVYQHSLTAMALPCQLILPESDPTITRGVSSTDGMLSSNQILLQQGAACNVLFLVSVDTESLTGPQAVRRAVSDLFSRNPMPAPTVVHFKVSGQGITLTDNKRRLFFRRHYPVNGISHCGLDPDDHRWTEKGEEFANSVSSNRCFGFVARKPSMKGDNQCHIFAELDPGQPATAIVNFVTRVMMAGTVGKTSNIV